MMAYDPREFNPPKNIIVGLALIELGIIADETTERFVEHHRKMRLVFPQALTEEDVEELRSIVELGDARQEIANIIDMIIQKKNH